MAYWAFSQKYLKSSLLMPALFGGDPVSKNTKKRLAIWNKVMIVLFILIPLVAFILLGVVKWHFVLYGKFYRNESSRPYFIWSYIVLSMIYILLQLVIASVLIYSVTSIRMIIGKYGL